MEGAKNQRRDDDAFIAGVATRIASGVYNTDEFCQDVADVILDSDIFWRKESQSKLLKKRAPRNPNFS